MRISSKLKKIICTLGVTILGVVAGCGSSGNTERENLTAYLSVVNVDRYSGAAVIVNGRYAGNGFYEGDRYYIPYDIVRGQIDKHYYMDFSENLLTYSSPSEIYDVQAGTDQVKVINDKAYIELSYIKEINNCFKAELYDNPRRVVITSEPVSVICQVSNDTQIRSEAGVSNTIVTDVKKGDKVYIVEKGDSWSMVMSGKGLTGYIKNTYIKAQDQVENNFPESWENINPYTYDTKPYKICLGWQQMEYAQGNSSLTKLAGNGKPLNTISPTWFKVSDAAGNITSLADAGYVNNAHGMNLEVWGLVQDFLTDDTGNYFINQVVTSTSSRRNLITNIMNEVKETGLDGINIDFENIKQTSAEGYVQFIRELAISCRENGVVLSVDMYVPSDINGYYDRAAVGEAADYLIIMGYDEHWSGCGQSGSVASLPFVEEGIKNTIADVDSKRVINAIPFYTRKWIETPVDYAPENAVIVSDNINGDFGITSQALGMEAAYNDLVSHGVEPVWDEELGQYYGQYYDSSADGNPLVRIWLEDDKSINEKLMVMEKYNLGGVACWKLGLEKDSVWEEIGSYVNK